MVEKALTGSRRYWMWFAVLLVLSFAGLLGWIREQQVGLGMTGLTRDVPWGLYIAQFVFFVGVGASALVVVLPYYLHDWKAFGKIAILGEILGMVAVFMAMLSIFVSIGRPMRLANVIIYPHPKSLIFWDLLVLSGYVLINAVITVALLSAERDEVAPPKWTHAIVLLSLPWAVAIHTVTAFLLSGLAARPYWMTALLAPRFLASAFTSGPALLILILLLLRHFRAFEVTPDALRRLVAIVTYFMLANVFFIVVEMFTVFYSHEPGALSHFDYLFAGMAGNSLYVPWTWASIALAVVALAGLLVPSWRSRPVLLAFTCASAFLSIWIDKGMALMVGGFVPTAFGVPARYTPTLPEWIVVLGIWAFGALLITVLFKIVLAVRNQVGEGTLSESEMGSAAYH